MFSSAKILAVDDEPDELEPIIGSLRTLGLGCIPFRYPDDIQHTDSFRGVRVLFLDINLVGGSSPGSGAARFSAPIRVIRQLIDDKNGPYALITWSSTEDHDELVARIGQTSFLANKQPFYSCAMPKSLADRPASLRAEVEKIFTQNAPFGSLLDWECRVTRAGDMVLDQLQGIASRLQGLEPSSRMDELLSRLAVGSFGKNAGHHKFEAVNEALLPMLSDEIRSEFHSAVPNRLWDRAITKCEIIGKINSELAAELNSKILLESGAGLDSHRRGAVVEVPSNWLPDPQFRRRFGETTAEIAKGLMLSQGSQPKWVLIQIQAACDFAQPKAAPIPFLLGSVVPADKQSKAGYVSFTPPFAAVPGLSQNAFKLAVFRTIPYLVARSTLKRSNLRVLARLRDQLIECLIHEHHSHGSRPGFISFD